MASSNSSIGGKLTLGTETPQQDVIDGWNFKVEGAGASGTGAQALELDGLVPFVQLMVFIMKLKLINYWEETLIHYNGQ